MFFAFIVFFAHFFVAAFFRLYSSLNASSLVCGSVKKNSCIITSEMLNNRNRVIKKCNRIFFTTYESHTYSRIDTHRQTTYSNHICRTQAFFFDFFSRMSSSTLSFFHALHLIPNVFPRRQMSACVSSLESFCSRRFKWQIRYMSEEKKNVDGRTKRQKNKSHRNTFVITTVGRKTTLYLPMMIGPTISIQNKNQSTTSVAEHST